MKRHLIHAVGVILAVSVYLSVGAGQARAQVGTGVGAIPGAGFTDPFAFYYAIYLPNQQLQSMRPGPLDSVNDAMVTRQYFAQMGRRSLTDPVSPYADTHDPLRPYSSQNERLSGPYRFSRDPSNMAGTGPSLYFNRISQYYPDMAGRTGRNRNANVTARGNTRSRGGRGMGGGMGMGGMGGGMGGMGGGMGGMPGMGMF
jgi:hypothetical protein